MRTMLRRSCLPILIFFLFTVHVHAAPPPLAGVLILIVRHAEKPDTGPGLAPAGQRRADAYVRYFRNYRIGFTPRPPDDLIASADSKNSRRPRLTLEPLSRADRLPLDTRFRDKDIASLVAALHAHPGGKTILICWHHGEIPALIQALGADPDVLLPHGRWPEDVYDWVIELHYDKDGRLPPAQARRIDERLLPGDAG